MLIQQLRQMEKDGVVRRIVHYQVPPKVEYCLTDWGQALCPALDALLTWAGQRPPLAEQERSEEHTSELQSLMRISYAVFCLKKNKKPYLRALTPQTTNCTFYNILHIYR